MNGWVINFGDVLIYLNWVSNDWQLIWGLVLVLHTGHIGSNRVVVLRVLRNQFWVIALIGSNKIGCFANATACCLIVIYSTGILHGIEIGSHAIGWWHLREILLVKILAFGPGLSWFRAPLAQLMVKPWLNKLLGMNNWLVGTGQVLTGLIAWKATVHFELV